MRKLKEIIDKSGIKKRYIADMLGISRAALYNKLNGEAEFLPSEIKCLQILLRLSDAEVKYIFLS